MKIYAIRKLGWCSANMYIAFFTSTEKTMYFLMGTLRGGNFKCKDKKTYELCSDTTVMFNPNNWNKYQYESENDHATYRIEEIGVL